VFLWVSSVRVLGPCGFVGFVVGLLGSSVYWWCRVFAGAFSCFFCLSCPFCILPICLGAPTLDLIFHVVYP
jgi:hypothetical protein